MSNTLAVAPELYTKPGLNATPGARVDYRAIALLTTDLITTQLIALGILPAGHRLMGVSIESTDLDTGTSPAITLSVGILNTYYGQAAATAAVPAAYSSGGATATDVDPQLVSGQNIITSSTLCQAGGRTNTMVLGFTKAIGVDATKDRIIEIQFPVVPTVAAAGTLGLIITTDEA